MSLIPSHLQPMRLRACHRDVCVSSQVWQEAQGVRTKPKPTHDLTAQPCSGPFAGIGFAKTDAGNVEVMAGLGQLRARLGGMLGRLPLLVGPSRKGFIGRLTGERG